MARSNNPSTAFISHRRPTRFASALDRPILAHAQQAADRNAVISTLDLNQLSPIENRCALNQPCGGRAEHHPTRRGHRLHPLGHPHLLADRGVAQGGRTDFASDHLTRIEPYAQGQFDAVVIANLRGQPCECVLDFQCRTTRPHGMVLQRHRRTETEHGRDGAGRLTAGAHPLRRGGFHLVERLGRLTC